MSPSTLLITDTNIWIDLDHGDLLEQVFLLPYSICTSDFAKEEIHTVDTDELERRGLSFLALEANFIFELARFRMEKPAIAIADMAGFILARENQAILVTGDKHLVVFSRENQVVVHGLLWLMDEMIENRILLATEAANKLRRMIEKGARLPNEECQRRLEKWK